MVAKAETRTANRDVCSCQRLAAGRFRCGTGWPIDRNHRQEKL